MNIFGIIATVFITVAYMPQIFQTYRTKDVTGVSFSFWIILSIGLTSALINSIIVYLSTGVYGYMILEIFNTGLAYVMLFMVAIYRKK